MFENPNRWAAKVHPATRGVEAEDPMELTANSVQGDPEVMLECIVQEYAWMGWGFTEILALLQDANYPALNQLFRYFGEVGTRERVRLLLGRMGVFRFAETIVEPTEPEEESELIQLTIRKTT